MANTTPTCSFIFGAITSVVFAIIRVLITSGVFVIRSVITNVVFVIRSVITGMVFVIKTLHKRKRIIRKQQLKVLTNALICCTKNCNVAFFYLRSGICEKLFIAGLQAGALCLQTNINA